MIDKKRMYEDKEMILPPLRLIKGDGYVPNPDGQRNAGKNRQILDPILEGAVKRLIAHLKDGK